jgi:hypothetical protein
VSSYTYTVELNGRNELLKEKSFGIESKVIQMESRPFKSQEDAVLHLNEFVKDRIKKYSNDNVDKFQVISILNPIIFSDDDITASDIAENEELQYWEESRTIINIAVLNGDIIIEQGDNVLKMMDNTNWLLTGSVIENDENYLSVALH